MGSAVEGENYDGAEMVFDSVTGGALTFMPSAADGTANPGWSNHAVDGIVSAETGAIVEGTKQATADKLVGAGGEKPW